MTTPIGAYEAKTRLPELLRAVAGGESFVITHRERAVAQLVPVTQKTLGVHEAVQALQAFAARPRAIVSTEVIDALRHEDKR